MCTHQHLIPEPQTRTSKRISKACQRRTFYIEDLTRSSYKNLLWASKNLHASTYAEQFEDLNASTSWGGFNRISTRPSHKDLYEITQHPLRGFHQDLSRIFSQGIVKDPDLDLHLDLHARTPKRIPQDRHKRPEDLTRSWYKNLPSASQKSFHRSTSNTWHLQDLDARTSVQDHARTS